MLIYPITMHDLSLKKVSKKLLLVTNNLNLEGAPLFFFNLAKGLKENGHSVEILSSLDGPLKSYFLKKDISVSILDFI